MIQAVYSCLGSVNAGAESLVSKNTTSPDKRADTELEEKQAGGTFRETWDSWVYTEVV